MVGGGDLLIASVQPVERDRTLGPVVRCKMLAPPQEPGFAAMPLPAEVARHALTRQAVMVDRLQDVEVLRERLRIVARDGKAGGGEVYELPAIEGDAAVHGQLTPAVAGPLVRES